jgi:hypothetical protein
MSLNCAAQPCAAFWQSFECSVCVAFQQYYQCMAQYVCMARGSAPGQLTALVDTCCGSIGSSSGPGSLAR